MMEIHKYFIETGETIVIMHGHRFIDDSVAMERIKELSDEEKNYSKTLFYYWPVRVFPAVE